MSAWSPVACLAPEAGVGLDVDGDGTAVLAVGVVGPGAVQGQAVVEADAAGLVAAGVDFVDSAG
ncbi:MAG: hypothetical protein OXH73_12160 [Caldilineaceae bacterium]|nr:hypothetical protein [Caldilineaceae bacterium]